MEKLDLRDSGPFTPEEAARRVKLASQQLKWFTLGHPHWRLAHVRCEWSTTYPLPKLPLPKGVRITQFGGISCKIKPSRNTVELVMASISAAATLSGIATMRAYFLGRGGWNDRPGLGYFGFTTTPQGNWVAKADVNLGALKDKKPAISKIAKLAGLESVKGWELVKPGCGYIDAELTLQITREAMKYWRPNLDAILSAQAAPTKECGWWASFQYEFQPYPNQPVWCGGSAGSWVWKPASGDAGGVSGDPEEFVKLVNAAGFPGTEAEVDFDCTVDRVEDFGGIFKLASHCKSCSGPIGIFETEKGKQGYMGFELGSKGIKLIVKYGPNGWESVHQELRRTGGKLVFPATVPAAEAAAAQAVAEEEARQFIRQIPAHAEKHRELAKSVFGINLDYSAKSIPKLEKMIKEGWPDGPPTMLDQVVEGIGSYLGETIRRVHGGDWRYNAEQGLHLHWSAKDMTIWPFAKVRKRFLNGEEDSLAFYYSYVRSQLEEGS